MGEEKEISLAGGRFAFTYELWLDRSTLDIEHNENVDPLSPRRYEEATLQEHAIIAEVYASLSPSLRACLANKDRRKSFKDTVRRSTLLQSKCSNHPQVHVPTWPRAVQHSPFCTSNDQRTPRA